jgi:hypothetical protein
MYIVWVSKVEYLITVNDNGLGGVAKLPRIRKLMRIIEEKKESLLGHAFPLKGHG